jgi:hypothetical protein
MTPVAQDIYIGNGCGYSMIWAQQTVTKADRNFIVAIYGAYNAHGLIGSECNGIVILDDDEKNVVLDEHAKADTGYYGASAQQRAEFEKIVAMSPDAFEIFVQSNPRSRFKDFKLNPGLKTRKAKKLNVRSFVTFVTNTDLGYNAEAKERFHKEGQQLLRTIAGKMGLNEDEYEVRSNLGGIAVSGEVTLHTTKVYVQLSQSSISSSHGFMYRSCKGMKDYTGGRNRWMKWSELVQIDNAVAAFKAAAEEGR